MANTIAIENYDVSGYMSVAELEELARLAGEGYVLEIGTWNGRSAIWMALGGATVYCLDTYLSDCLGDGIVGGWTLGNLVDAARRYDVYKRIKPICAPWEMLLASMDLDGFTLLHYDADHGYQATFDACTVLLASPATLCVHDYDWPETKQAVDELAVLFGRKVRVVGALAILERVA